VAQHARTTSKAMFSGELSNMVHGQKTNDGDVCRCRVQWTAERCSSEWCVSARRQGVLMIKQRQPQFGLDTRLRSNFAE